MNGRESRLEVEGDSFAITVRVAGANNIEELVGIHSYSGNVYDALAHQIHSFPGAQEKITNAYTPVCNAERCLL